MSVARSLWSRFILPVVDLRSASRPRDAAPDRYGADVASAPAAFYGAAAAAPREPRPPSSVTARCHVWGRARSRAHTIGAVGDEQPAGWERIGIAGRLLQRSGEDQRTLMEQLAGILEGVLPDATRVRRAGGFLSTRRVAELSLMLGDYRYILRDEGGHGLSPSRSHVVRGVAISTSPMSMEEWLSELVAALQARAETSGAARDALARLLA